MAKINRSVRNFTDIATFIAEQTASTADSFSAAFASNYDGFSITGGAAEIPAEMPDAMQVQLAVELIITTLFDVLRDTRLQSAADHIAWGIVNALHKESDLWSRTADNAARQLKELLGTDDLSEIHNVEVERVRDSLTILDEAGDALACMRDHAIGIYSNETGKPWSAPRATLVSSKRTASVIDGRDYLAARRLRRAAAHYPQGPLVVFSGGTRWSDEKPIYRALNEMKAMRPSMVLLTTGQDLGADAIALAWAAKTKTTVVKLGIDKRRWGDRAGFVRNDQIARLQPIDGIVAEGTGVQSQLCRVLRSVGVEPVLLSLYGGPTNWAY